MFWYSACGSVLLCDVTDRLGLLVLDGYKTGELSDVLSWVYPIFMACNSTIWDVAIVSRSSELDGLKKGG